MPYFDSTIRAGYYDAFQITGLDHTYLILDCNGEEWAFPCFGSIARSEGDFGNRAVKYPADLWTPYTFGSRNLGSALPANLHVALGIAQFRPDPAYNYRISEWEAYWRTSSGGVGCWAGIVYGVAGVCQQACNRILWCTQVSDFDQSAVNWPPSFSKSYWVYGYWGFTTQMIARGLASLLVAETQRRVALPVANPPDLARLTTLGTDVPLPSITPTRGAPIASAEAAPSAPELAAGVGLDSDTRLAMGQMLRGALGNPETQDRRRREIVEMVASAPAGERVASASVPMSGLLTPDAKFTAVKEELDKQLLRGEISHDEYATQVNRAFTTMLDELRNVLPPETFQALFPDGATTELIVRREMPPSYEIFGKAAGI